MLLVIVLLLTKIPLQITSAFLLMCTIKVWRDFTQTSQIVNLIDAYLSEET